MLILRHNGKILRHHHKTLRHHHFSGGNINHLIHKHHNTGGNINELKKQLSHLVLGKSKKVKRIKF